MIPVDFPEANATFLHPPDLEESQCQSVRAYRSTVNSGALDGVPIVVTAWKPSDTDIARITSGQPVFLAFIGTGLPPHLLATSFKEATNI